MRSSEYRQTLQEYFIQEFEPDMPDDQKVAFACLVFWSVAPIPQYDIDKTNVVMLQYLNERISNIIMMSKKMSLYPELLNRAEDAVSKVRQYIIEHESFPTLTEIIK